MFLATTALSDFWDGREEILFLGSWCLRQDRRSCWENLSYRLLPSPWNDRRRFYEAAEYLDACGERVLVHLARRLNALHGIQAPEKYWRVLIGPWLLHHLHVLYDRYAHLRAAFEMEPGLKTLCLDPVSFRVPEDGAKHIRWILEDPYNLQLYSGLLAGMGYSFPTRPCNAREDPEPSLSFPRKAARWGWGGLQRTGLALLRSRWKVALYETGLPKSAVWKMAWRTGFRAQPLGLQERWNSLSPAPRFDERRNSLSGLPATDEFERLFARMLPQDFPSLYLEEYAAARELARRSLPDQPSVLLSGMGWHFHEPFKWVAAEATLKKRRLVALQHGGGYGVYRFTSMERHEKKISDSFLSWGWANGDGHAKNVPAPQLPVAPRRPRGSPSRGSGPILFVATTNPRYFYRFFSAPQGSQMEDYFQWQLRFFQALPERLRNRVRFRPHSHPYPHGFRERFSERFPEVRFDPEPSFRRSLRGSSLTVIDHLSTPLLEALALNRPTLLFWDPERWEIRPEAQNAFDSLRRTRILQDSPEEAAARLENISEEPERWWSDPSTQQARRQFADRYARSSGDWAGAWRRTLTDEIAQAVKP